MYQKWVVNILLNNTCSLRALCRICNELFYLVIIGGNLDADSTVSIFTRLNDPYVSRFIFLIFSLFFLCLVVLFKLAEFSIMKPLLYMESDW